MALDIAPDVHWFDDVARFKDVEKQGLLTVRLRPEECKDSAGAPSRLFSVKTTLARYSASAKERYAYAWLLPLLLLGALSSLYINYKFPDDSIRRDLKRRLNEIENAIDSLSTCLPSRLRVLSAVDRLTLTQRLKTLRWFSVGFESARSQIDQAVTRLKRRVDILERMGLLSDAYERLKTLDVPPTVLDRIEALYDQTVKIFESTRPSDADLQKAESKLADLDGILSGWEEPQIASQADSLLAVQIAARLRSLHDDLNAGGVLDKSSTWKLLAPQFRGLVDQLRRPPLEPTQIPANEYHPKDWLTSRGTLLRSYAQLCDDRNPGANSPLLTKQPELIELLKTDRWDDLQRARRLVSEMRLGVYANDIGEEIKARRVEIRWDRSQIRRFEPIQFYLEFLNPKFESSPAREEWACRWDFGHQPLGWPDNEKAYFQEDGRSVAHYFPEAREHTLKVSFRPKNEAYSASSAYVVTRVVVVGDSGPEVACWRRIAGLIRSNGSELARLGLALLPVIFGLVAGAKDQLLKLDLIPALIAVFLLGFGSDQVKNLLSQKTTGT